MALTKAEMSEYLFDKLGLSKRDAKNQRPGRNPKTGEDIPITARRVVTFRPGQKLKSRVENATPKAE